MIRDHLDTPSDRLVLTIALSQKQRGVDVGEGLLMYLGMRLLEVAESESEWESPESEIGGVGLPHDRGSHHRGSRHPGVPGTRNPVREVHQRRVRI